MATRAPEILGQVETECRTSRDSEHAEMLEISRSDSDGIAAALIKRDVESGRSDRLGAVGADSVDDWLDSLSENDLLTAPLRRRRDSDLKPVTRLSSLETPAFLCLPLSSPCAAIFDLVLFFDTSAACDTAARRAVSLQKYWSNYLAALSARDREQTTTDALRFALNFSANAYFLIDADRRVQFANAAAGRLVADGGSLIQSQGRLGARDLTDALKFAEIVNHSVAKRRLAGSADGAADPGTADTVCPVLMLPGKNGDELLCVVKELPASLSGDGAPAAMVVVLQSQRDVSRVLKPVCLANSLTTVETELVSYLVAGISLTEASERMKIKRETARGYLKSIFSKTGTHRQSELVQRLMSYMLRIDPLFELELAG